MSGQPWKVVPHVRTARSGRERRSYTVERCTGEVVLEGFSDDPAVYKRRREAQDIADQLNPKAQSPASGATGKAGERA